MGTRGRFIGQFVALVGLVVLLTAAASLPAPPVHGMIRTGVSGYVRDGFGDPVAGATVSNSQSRVVTGPDGYYELRTVTPANPWVSVKADGFEPRAARADAGTQTLDFALRYHLVPYIGPVAAANNVPERRLRVFAAALSAARCIGVVDEHAGTTTLLRRAPRHMNTGPYRGEMAVAPRPDGVYGYTATATDCETGTVDAGRVSRSFIVDSKGPVITFTSSRFTNDLSPEIEFVATDEFTGVNQNRFHATIDGQPVPVTFDGETGRVSAPDLGEGVYGLTVSMFDGIGNGSAKSVHLRVDATAPAVVSAEPSGDTGDATPLIRVRLKDVGVGIDDATTVLRLSDGVRIRTLAAEYHAPTRTLTYQVPATAAGAELGDGPLAPGTYTVWVTAADKAGNVLDESWPFRVVTPVSPA